MQSKTIKRLLSPFEQFVHSLGTGFGDWRLKKPLMPWVNDGLMAFFFFLVGLEIKCEILVGELSVPRDAVPAVDAALGLALLGRRASSEAG